MGSPYFAPSYFGGTTCDAAGPLVLPPDPAAADDFGPVGSDWQILAWMRRVLVDSGLFAAGQVVVGRIAASSDETLPRAWIFPVGFNDRNDATDLANRTATVAVNLGVPYARPGGDDLGSYRELERFESIVTPLLEPGPPGVNPSLGGLLKGTYDSPAGQKQSTVTPLGFMLAMTLYYSFNYDRDK